MPEVAAQKNDVSSEFLLTQSSVNSTNFLEALNDAVQKARWNHRNFVDHNKLDSSKTLAEFTKRCAVCLLVFVSEVEVHLCVDGVCADGKVLRCNARWRHLNHAALSESTSDFSDHEGLSCARPALDEEKRPRTASINRRDDLLSKPALVVVQI